MSSVLGKTYATVGYVLLWSSTLIYSLIFMYSVFLYIVKMAMAEEQYH